MSVAGREGETLSVRTDCNNAHYDDDNVDNDDDDDGGREEGEEGKERT